MPDLWLAGRLDQPNRTPFLYQMHKETHMRIDSKTLSVPVVRRRARYLTGTLAFTFLLLWSLTADAQTTEACNNIGECFTADEYAETFSVPGLVSSGVFTDPVDNGDGTTTLWNVTTGVYVTVNTDPLTRPVAATPTLEPDAPTIGEILFNLPSPATATRKAALV